MVLIFDLFAVIHYFLSPLLVAHGFIPELLSNLLFMVGASYYHYLNFLGYDGKTLTDTHYIWILQYLLIVVSLSVPAVS